MLYYYICKIMKLDGLNGLNGNGMKVKLKD